MWKKKLPKPLSSLLVVLLVLSSLQLSPTMVAKAEEGAGEKTYSMEQLGDPAALWGTAIVALENGAKEYTFDGQYKAVIYKIPDEIDFSKVDKMTFNVTDGNADDFAYKTYTEAAFATDNKPETQVSYGNPVFVPEQDKKDGIKYIGLMSCKEEGGTMSVRDVTFSLSDNVAEKMDITYNFIDLQKLNSYNVSLQVGEGGDLKLDYANQHAETFYALPEGIDGSKVKKLTLNYVSGNSQNIAIKLYKDGVFDKSTQDPAYGNNTIVPTTDFDAFGIMSLKENISAKISGVTLTIEGKAEIQKKYPFADIVEVKKNEEIVSNKDVESGKQTIVYPEQNKEIFFEIPKEIDSTKVQKISYEFSSGNADKFAFKYYTEDNFAGNWPSAPKEQVVYRSSESVLSNGFGGVKYIGIMSLDAEAVTAVIDSITFHTTGWGYVEEEPEEENPGAQEPVGDKTFTADKLSVEWGNASYELVDGKYKMVFTQQYHQVRYKIPETIDLSNCTAVKFTVADQTVPIALKLWSSGKEIESLTSYGNSGATEYTITPTSNKEIVDAIGVMYAGKDASENAGVALVSVTFTMKGGSTTQQGDNIIQNPNFADTSEEGMKAWTMAAGKSIITAETSETAIYSDVKTYGKIARNPENSAQSDGFAQDITDKVKKDEEYAYEFYAMLSEDYNGAEANKCQVNFAPYITASGKTEYLGGYSSQISGEATKSLTPGKWTKFSGTFKISCSGELEKVVIRIIEQGSDYSNKESCVCGDFYVTGVSMRKIVKEKIEIEQDIPNWKDSLVKDLGAGTIAGTAVTVSEMDDESLMDLVTKHFNAVTPGNELKLDAMLNYKNDECPEGGTETVDFNGKQLLVPVLDHSRADKVLDKILAWNTEHPETPLKVRGHVLVWHSQAPEWFFREDYKKDAPFVSKEVMDLRLEWYIKTMLEYYTGSSSKYKDLFYGWDVVNEAINDRTNTYRGASGESSWAAVYGDKSNEYIIKAFQFANKYAPASLELYYNDYNDCVPGKRDGIVKLLQAVKAAEGTRIDGMGMQGHYNMESPTAKQFEDAVRAYAAVVGKVQLTELDFKASSKYDGTDATKAEEYTKQAYRYKMFYDVAKKLDAEEGIDVSGITVWGVVDKYSWLQNQSNVGGGASGNQVQCPLLFDDNYKAKPSYWAFVDPTKLEPSTQSMTIIEAGEAGFDNAKTYSFSGGDTVVTFLPVWSDKTVKVLVNIKDATVDETDSVTLFIDEANSKADGITPKKVTVKRSEGKAVANGYQAELSLDLASAFVSKKIGFDLRVVDGATNLSFNDLKNTQDGSSKYYAEASLKPYATVNKGTAKVDGVKEDIWNTDGVKIPLTINLGSNVKADVTALWDENYLYILAEVQDSVLNKDSANAYEQDSLEVFIDENNHKSESYEEDDKQYRINYLNEQSFNGAKCKAENVVSATKVTEGGYLVEAAFKWTDITPANGTEIGLEFQINDAGENGKRSGTLSWYDETGMGWSAPGVYGTVKLVAAEHKHQLKKLEGKAATCTEDGLTVAYECTDCKALFADEKGEKNITAADRVIQKLGHSYETTLKAATCTADGEKVTVCKNCKDTTKETIKAVGHTYQNGVCSVCQAKDPDYKPETEVEVVTKPETQQVANAVKDEIVSTVSESIKAVKAELEAAGETVSTDKLVATVKEALKESKSEAVKAVVDAVSEKTLEKVVLATVENKEISVAVVARPVSAAAVNETAKRDAEKIEKIVANNGAVAQYLELSVLIQAKDAEGKVETLGTVEEPTKEFTFILSVPKNLQKEGRVFYVIRVHNDGEAEKLAVVDNKDGTISFKTDKFSTYALAYADEEPAGGDNSSGGSGATEESTPTQNTTSGKVAPQTGDANKVAEWAAIFAASLGAMLFILKKKRQM